MGRASSFDEEVFSAHRVIPDVTHGRSTAGGSGSDFSPPNSEPFTQVLNPCQNMGAMHADAAVLLPPTQTEPLAVWG